jgi:ferritin-like metal-binding protein YciE
MFGAVDSAKIDRKPSAYSQQIKIQQTAPWYDPCSVEAGTNNGSNMEITRGVTTMAHQDTVIAWLNDAHALELNLVQVLEHRVSDTKDHPHIQTRVQQHLEQTRRHAELVKGCIERLGGSTSTVKSAMGQIGGFFQGVSTGMAKDEMVKNALADYASEQFEIASYTSLIAAAQAIGDQQTATVCQQILRDEDEMARWLQQQIPIITQEFLGMQAREHGAA